MERLFGCVLLIAVLALVSPACAKFEVIAQSPYDENHPLHLGETTNWCKDFPEDAYTLIALEDGKVLASERYCAAYGRTEASGFTDRVGRKYALQVYGSDHGTVREDYLHVYWINSGKFREILTIPVDTSMGPCGTETYSYTASASRKGGLRLTLQLNEDKYPGEDCFQIWGSLRPPPVKKRVITIDTPYYK